MIKRIGTWISEWRQVLIAGVAVIAVDVIVLVIIVHVV
jgi:hypothetical protein